MSSATCALFQMAEIAIRRTCSPRFYGSTNDSGVAASAWGSINSVEGQAYRVRLKLLADVRDDGTGLDEIHRDRRSCQRVGQRV
jgi:hypothetical protein